MVYGNPHQETIEVNEESLWSGKQLTETFKSSPDIIEKIRALLFEGKNNEAAMLCANTLLSSPSHVRFYESFGEIFIDFEDKSEYTNYKKTLDIDTAVCEVAYEKNGISYKSETFVSNEYDILAYKISADSFFRVPLL